MDVSYLELKNHYAALTTDELLAIYLTSDLTKTASELICIELNKRNITPDQYRSATESARDLQAFRADTREHIGKPTRRLVTVLLVFALLAIGTAAWEFLSQ